MWLLQTSYQYLVQKLTRDLEMLLDRTRGHGDADKLSVERTDGCMRIMKQLGQSRRGSGEGAESESKRELK